MRIVHFDNDKEYQIRINNHQKTIELFLILREDTSVTYRSIIKIPIQEPIYSWGSDTHKYWFNKLKTLNLFS